MYKHKIRKVAGAWMLYCPYMNYALVPFGTWEAACLSAVRCQQGGE